MSRVRYARGAAAVALPSALLFLCQCGSGAEGASSGESSPAATASAPPSASASASAPADPVEDDDSRPVYPQTKDPPLPEAEKYCDLIYEAAERRRVECCPSMPFTAFRPTGECVRTLSYALRSGAVTLEKADLDACEAAVAVEAKQCDWGGVVPAACKKIVRGRVADGELCRSSIECKLGSHCTGLGVSRPGKCTPPRPDGSPCGSTVDPLGAFIAHDVEPDHPQCAGHCERRRCAPFAPLGGECLSSVACGKDRSCRDKKCSDAPMPKASERCLGRSCAAGHTCVDGTCVVERRIGEECAVDAECRSRACEVKQGAKGQCVANCQIIRPAKPATSGSGSRPAPSR